MSAFASIPRGYIWIAAIVALALLLGAGMWMEYVQTYHLATVTPNLLYRDGFRSVREFRTAVGNVGARTVVRLLDADERQKDPFNLEEDFCSRGRISLHTISVPLGGWPSGKDIQAFLDITHHKKHLPILVHCAQGVRRTG